MFFVCMLASKPHGTLYVGVTTKLMERVAEHKTRAVPGFTAKYGVDRLVWYEPHEDWESAVLREKRIKEWSGIGRSRCSSAITRNGSISIMTSRDRIVRLREWIPAFAGMTKSKRLGRKQ